MLPAPEISCSTHGAAKQHAHTKSIDWQKAESQAEIAANGLAVQFFLTYHVARGRVATACKPGRRH